MGIFKSGQKPTKKKNRYIPAFQGNLKLKIACWNIRTMLDTADSGLPEQCSALVAHELLSLNIDIPALSEVCLPREGSLQEYGAGYTLYWSSKPDWKIPFWHWLYGKKNLYFQTRKPAIRPLRPHNLHVPPTSKQEACYTLFSVCANPSKGFCKQR